MKKQVAEKSSKDLPVNKLIFREERKEAATKEPEIIVHLPSCKRA